MTCVGNRRGPHTRSTASRQPWSLVRVCAFAFPGDEHAVPRYGWACRDRGAAGDALTSARLHRGPGRHAAQPQPCQGPHGGGSRQYRRCCPSTCKRPLLSVFPAIFSCLNSWGPCSWGQDLYKVNAVAWVCMPAQSVTANQQPCLQSRH